MGVQGNVDLHFWVTRGMARRLGINLSDAMREGVLTREDFADMVTRCRACPGTQGCMAFLSEQGGRSNAAPDWCCNARLLNELRALI
jgi:hypothetical protein